MSSSVERWLAELADELIEAAVMETADIVEGRVITVGPPPYRRLDCDERALAYIRVRPKKKAVRVDVSGLWLVPRASTLVIPGAGASATLLIRTRGQLPEAVKFLTSAVDMTRRRLGDATSTIARPATGYRSDAPVDMDHPAELRAVCAPEVPAGRVDVRGDLERGVYGEPVLGPWE